LGQPGELVSNGRMGGMREDDANVRMGVSAYDRISGLREDDASLRLGVSAYDRLKGLREDDASLRLGVSAYDIQKKALSGFTRLVLSGLREDDAALMLRRSMGAKMFRSALPEAADDYRLHRYTKKLSGDEKYEVAGWLDFLKPAPSADEYLGKLQLLTRQWNSEVKPNLLSLPNQSRSAIESAMSTAQCSFADYVGMDTFLAEGAAGLQAYPGRIDRVNRLTAYLPTLRTLIGQAKASGQAATPSAEQARVDAAQAANVDQRISDKEAEKNLLTGTILPIAGGVALLGGGILLATKLAH
jgi:hypothetical protein